MILKHFNKKYILKSQAQNRARTAIKNGTILKPCRCEHCQLETKRLEAHHNDYNKPLEVIFLCIKCHRIEHKRIRENSLKDTAF